MLIEITNVVYEGYEAEPSEFLKCWIDPATVREVSPWPSHIRKCKVICEQGYRFATCYYLTETAEEFVERAGLINP